MINLITGRPGSGKTVSLYDKIIEHKTEDNIIIVNPQSIDAFESFLTENSVSAVLLSSETAAEHIAETIGMASVKIASSAERGLIISDIIRTSEDLMLITPEYAYTGVVSRLNNAISDIYKEGSSHRAFAKWVSSSKFSGTSYKKFHDFSIICDRFMERLKELNLVCKEEFNLKMIETLKSFKGKLCDNLFVDTLAEYTKSTTEMLCALLLKADNAYITFRSTDARHSDYFAFTDSVEAIRTIKSEMQGKVPVNEIKATRKVKAKKVENLRSGIELISEHFFDSKFDARNNDSDSVKLVEATTPAGEVNIMCSEIMRLHNNGMRYDDIVVSSPVIEDYITLIESAFYNYNIPHRYFKASPLNNSRMYEYIDTLLTCAENKECSLASLSTLTRLNFIELTEEEVSEVELFEKRFGDNYDTALENCQKYAPEMHSKVTTVFQKIEDAVAFFSDSISDCNTAEEYASTIMFSLELGDVKKSLLRDLTNLNNANEYQLCNETVSEWNAMMDVLDCIVSNYAEQEIDLSVFCKAFRKICDDKKVVNNNKYFGEVKIFSLPEVANGRSRALFVLGCNEDKLISVPEESFFTAAEKIELNKGLGISLPDNKQYIAKKIANVYSSFTTPYDILEISWSRFSSSYSSISKARVLNSIISLQDGKIITEEEYSCTEGEDDFINLLSQISVYKGDNLPDDLQRKVEYYTEHPMFSHRLSKAVNSLNRNSQSFEVTSFPTVSELSVTRAEKFNECPFKHFVTFYLKPKIHKMFEENAANIGVFYHGIFKSFYEKVKADGLSYKTLAKDRAQVDAILEPIIETELSVHNENVLSSTARYKFTANKMKETLRTAVFNSVRQVAAGEFEPSMFEQDITKVSNTSVALSNGQTVTMSGIIDRVDLAKTDSGTYARIIDYKSGKTEFNKEKLKLGVQLQLPMYMAALKDYKFGGMYYFHVHRPYLSADALDTDVLKDFKLSGLTYKDDEIPEKTDSLLGTVGCSVSSDVVSIRKSTKGEFYATSAIASDNDINAIMEMARDNFTRAAEGIASGVSEAVPAITKTYSACTYCAYNPICGRAKTLPKF